MKFTYIVYSVVYFIYAALIFPFLILLSEYVVFPYSEVLTLVACPVLIGLLLALPFNRIADRINRTKKSHTFNSVFVTTALVTWLVYLGAYHLNSDKYLLMIYQQQPLVITDNKPLDKTFYGYIRIENTTIEPKHNHMFVYDKQTHNVGARGSYRGGRQIRFIAAPLTPSKETTYKGFNYWATARTYALETREFTTHSENPEVMTGFVQKQTYVRKHFLNATKSGPAGEYKEADGKITFIEPVNESMEELKNTYKIPFYILMFIQLTLSALIWKAHSKSIKREVC
ncbi:MAG: hypothetical protein MH137_02440 [Flavobacteriales bacterium]|nr:hypothetical protein [Flavobacteriales bacterium]